METLRLSLEIFQKSEFLKHFLTRTGIEAMLEHVIFHDTQPTRPLKTHLPKDASGRTKRTGRCYILPDSFSYTQRT